MRLPLLLLAFIATNAGAQSTMAPVNDAPNPYRTVAGWAKMPAGRTWGSTSAVDVDIDGKSVWVAERCGVNNCVGSELNPVLKFDADGNLVTAFGAGLILSPHAIQVDREGNVWVVDCSCTLGRGGPPAPAGKGHQIFKFSPTGKLLLTLGTPGGAYGETVYFRQPNDIIFAPNGDFYVSEGHSSADTANARILRFSNDGKLIQTWGKRGAGPGELDQPHSLAFDSRGRLFVADRGNNRILIYTQDGKLLDTWYQFSRPSAIYIDAADNLYVGDSESGTINKAHGAWKRGVRIGSAKDGVVRYFIPDPDTEATGTSSAEGIAVDAAGHIFGAEVGQKALKRYEKP
jgi:DNA-binding beta-propeller fold protein YncE